VRSKVTFLLLALNLALFGYLLLSEHPWSATTRIEENRRRVLGPEAANLCALTITTRPAPDAPPGSAPTTLRLERRGETWFLAAPLDYGTGRPLWNTRRQRDRRTAKERCRHALPNDVDAQNALYRTQSHRRTPQTRKPSTQTPFRNPRT
jgi:hypothetical protein